MNMEAGRRVWSWSGAEARIETERGTCCYHVSFHEASLLGRFADAAGVLICSFRAVLSLYESLCPMNFRTSHSPEAYARMNTAELRRAFLVETLFTPDVLDLTYWEVDRSIIGSAVPRARPVSLEVNPKLIGADFFLQRRELGVINLGGPGVVEVEGVQQPLARLETLYVGRGTRRVVFLSLEPANPARFYLVSYPAHADHPMKLVRETDARRIDLGKTATANVRTIRQQIYEGGVPTCQLVMGYTELAEGSLWNTFPPHTHLRRSEVYLYFDLPADQAVIHFMGPGEETRHLMVRNGQAVLSPPWSIHAGCGTAAYRFVWAMGGENQRFDDMDPVPVVGLK